MQDTQDATNANTNLAYNNQHFVCDPEYSANELAALRAFVEIVKDESQRSDLVCWGDHTDYSKGY